ncbi:MAG TPA: hypothetical protein VGS79_14565 [Puia sp.]|nr:hypothetical protein [Puia sp.]
MKLVHTLAWLFFIGVLAFDIGQYLDLVVAQRIPGNLFGLPFLPPTEAAHRLCIWSNIVVRQGGTALDQVRLNTRWDFLFIVGYVTVLINLSYAQMQNESRSWANTLLRFNFPLAIFAGLCDVTENFILLRDMLPYIVCKDNYISPYYFSSLKFIFGGAAVIILLFSVTSAPKSFQWKTRIPVPPPPSPKQ